MATDNILEAVERLEKIAASLERVLYGDPPGRPQGLLAEFEKLRQDVAVIHDDLGRLKAKRANVWMWVLGYFSFWAAVGFGMAATMNQIDGHDVWQLPADIASVLTVLFACGALLLFLGGFGWLDRA